MCTVLRMTLVLYINNHICYSTCDSVQSIKRMVNSDDIQESDSSIFKPYVAHCCILRHGSVSDVTAGSIHRIPGILQPCNGLYLSEMFVACR